MNDARLAPDGHAVAFVSPVGGVAQVFLMLSSGSEPLQLTNDEGDKVVDTFSPDGTEIYYERSIGREEVWAVPTLGGTPRRVVSGNSAVPSVDGEFIYYVKSDSSGLFRAGKTGLNEELVYNSEGSRLFFIPLLLFPGGNDLLAAGERRDSPNIRFSRINVTTHEAVDLGAVSGNRNLDDIVWAEPGMTLLLSRTVNGLTNIWKYSLQDRSLTQITFGAGPDFSPMPDPGGKGIYFVNGKSSGFLTAYHVHSKESTDIVTEDATQPVISPDGKRVMYITLPSGKNHELWVSNINGGNKLKIATGDETLSTGTWASDNIHLSFFEVEAGAESKNYIVGADGVGFRQLPWSGMQMDRLKVLSLQAGAIARENNQLRSALGWQRQMPWKLKLANVVLRDPANWWRTIEIDLGARDGMVENLPVLTAEGLVGRISSVGVTRSQVVLFGDPNCKASALVENPAHDTGIISASGPLDSSLVHLTYLSGSANLKPGQGVVTSGIGGIFPKGIPIGQIVDSRTGRIWPLHRGARETERQPRRARTSLGADECFHEFFEHHFNFCRRLPRGVRRSRFSRAASSVGRAGGFAAGAHGLCCAERELIPSPPSPFLAGCGSTRFRRIRSASRFCRCSPSVLSFFCSAI